MALVANILRTGNGSTVNFLMPTTVFSESHIRVYLNNSVVTNWDLFGDVVIFNTAPTGELNFLISDTGDTEDFPYDLDSYDTLASNIGAIENLFEIKDLLDVNAENIGNLSIVGSCLSENYAYIEDCGSIDDEVESGTAGECAITTVAENMQNIIDVNTNLPDIISSATTATEQAVIATEQAVIATAQANIATDKANESSASATASALSESNALAYAQSASNSADISEAKALEAYDSANIATSASDSASLSASTATEQATIATSKALEASTSANISTTQALIATNKATEAQLKAWEAEAERMTSDSYATEPEDTFVKVYTSNGDGTFTATNTTEYSSLHWANKSQGFAAQEDIFVDSLQLSGGTGDQGKITWNVDEETVDLIQNDAVLQLGQEVQVHCRNGSGSIITNGTIVMASGTIGASSRIVVEPYTSGSSPSLIVGVATYDILNGEDGKITSFGKVRGIDTNSYTEGQVLYVGDNGSFTTTQPIGALSEPIAFVVYSGNNGVIMVRVPTFSESLPDQAGNSGKFLTTDGTEPSWQDVDAYLGSIYEGL